MVFDDPAFWRAGAISTIAVMTIVLIMLTIDSLAAISPGGSHVSPYTVINRHIDYKFDSNRGFDVPLIGAAEPLFGKSLDEPAAAVLIDRGKMVIQTPATSSVVSLGGDHCDTTERDTLMSEFLTALQESKPYGPRRQRARTVRLRS
jgi:hypothetical protein